MKIAATSSSEGEIIAAAESLKTGIHFQSVFEGVGTQQKEGYRRI